VLEQYGYLRIDLTWPGVDQLRSFGFDELLLQLLFVLLGSNKKNYGGAFFPSLR